VSGSNVLVLTFATFRGGPLAWNSLLRHVVQPNRADTACISVAEQCAAQQPLFKFTYTYTHANYNEDWGKYVEDRITKSDAWRRALCRPEVHQRPGMDGYSQFDFLGGVKNCAQKSTGGIMLFYRQMAAELLEEKRLLGKYEWYIWTRVDYIFLCPPPQPVHLDPAKVHIPRGDGWGGYTDRFAVVPARLAPVYFNVSKDVLLNWQYWDSLLLDASFKGNCEAVIKRYLDRMGTPVSLFPHTGVVVKRDVDHTSWLGNVRNWVTDHPVLKDYGLTIKYPDEMKEAEEACKEQHPWEGFRKWAGTVVTTRT